PAPPRPPAEDAGPSPRGEEDLLLVEDNARLRTALAAALGDLGYRVRVAADGAEALARFAEGGAPPQAVLCDVVLPDLAGPELVERLRATAPELPVLFLSGASGAAVAGRDRRGRPVPLLAKPFTVDTLARALRRLLDDR
ncbi:MAG TPA: response regulator, partial [Thermoanaerobaculia bacterium]|nr:response regulator [Thermoanaerobaculia bacterium]